MQIRDLGHWPPSVWVTTGITRLIPDLATARIKSVRVDEECVFLRFEGGDKIYGTALVLNDKHSARCVNSTLQKAIGKTVKDAGDLEVEKIRVVRFRE